MRWAHSSMRGALRRNVLAAGVVAALGLGLGACGDSGSSSSAEAPRAGAKGTVKIGLPAPLSGRSAADGEMAERGARLAIDEINARGGVEGYTFQLVPADVEDSTPDKVTKALERLFADDEVEVLTTTYASTSNFEFDMVAERGMPYLIGGNPDQTQAIVKKDPDRYATIWCLNPVYDLKYDLFRFMDDSAADGKAELRDRTVFMINSDNPYSTDLFRNMKRRFVENGWKIVGEENVPSTQISDWRGIITKIKSANPDVITNFDYNPSNEALFLQQFLENPSQSYLWMDYAPSVPEFIELTGDQANGVIWSLLGAPIRTLPRTQEIVEKYKDKYGDEPSGVAPQLYDQVYMYAEALEKVRDPKDHAAIGKALGEMRMETTRGLIELDPKTHTAKYGDDHIPAQYFQYQDEEVATVSPSTIADGELTNPPWWD